MKKYAPFIVLFVLPFLLIGCGKDEDVIGSEAIQMIMPEEGKARHPEHGLETWFAYGAMTGTDTSPANGVVQAYLFEGGSYVLSMQLNVLPPADGMFYEAWLVDPESNELIPTGHLGNYFGDARHQLTFDTEDDLSTYLSVVVTLERDDGNPNASENVVARGQLKPTER